MSHKVCGASFSYGSSSWYIPKHVPLSAKRGIEVNLGKIFVHIVALERKKPALQYSSWLREYTKALCLDPDLCTLCWIKNTLRWRTHPRSFEIKQEWRKSLPNEWAISLCKGRTPNGKGGTLTKREEHLGHWFPLMLFHQQHQHCQ